MSSMLLSVSWFVGIAVLAVGMYLLGRRLGTCRPLISNSAMLLAIVGVGAAASLRFRPVLLHQLLPLDISIWFDGLVALFPWMALVGMLRTSEIAENLRKSVPLLMVLGLVYFLFGGIWMVLPTIRIGEPENRSSAGIIIQNRHDTCVPASAANALRMMDIPASEERMCPVVLAKPTRGSSLARAAYGLRSYVAKHDMKLSLMDLTADEAADIATKQRPALVIIRSGPAADHMVVLLGKTDDGNVLIANSSPGEHGGIPALPTSHGYGFEVFRPDDFARLYRRGAIIFEDLTP